MLLGFPASGWLCRPTADLVSRVSTTGTQVRSDLRLSLLLWSFFRPCDLPFAVKNLIRSFLASDLSFAFVCDVLS